MTPLVIRGGTVVTSAGPLECDVAVDAGRIAAIGQELPGGRDEIDARGLHVLPAAIDVHLHFNEPGRTEWEGAATGSRGAGGWRRRTVLRHAAEFDAVHGHAPRVRSQACGAGGGVDYRLRHLGRPRSRARSRRCAEMAARGVVGFKAFMCDSGLPEFPRADDVTLLDGMAEAARLGLPVAVHAESEELTRRLAAQATGTWRARLPRLAPHRRRARRHPACIAVRW